MGLRYTSIYLPYEVFFAAGLVFALHPEHRSGTDESRPRQWPAQARLSIEGL